MVMGKALGLAQVCWYMWERLGEGHMSQACLANNKCDTKEDGTEAWDIYFVWLFPSTYAPSAKFEGQAVEVIHGKDWILHQPVQIHPTIFHVVLYKGQDLGYDQVQLLPQDYKEFSYTLWRRLRCYPLHIWRPSLKGEHVHTIHYGRSDVTSERFVPKPRFLV